MSRIVDLSMPVHRDMVTFPRINPPQMLMFDTWEDFAKGVGADKYGVDKLTASYTIIQSDHAGTHMDAVKHIRPNGPGASEIPLEYCFSDGVVLDFRHKEYGAGISAAEIDEALDKIGYKLKEKDIALIQTGASAYNDDQERYLRDHCGMTREATLHLISKGVRMMGIDAVTFDPPVWAMFEREQFWEAHRVMWEEDYWHLENLCNLDQLPPYGFKLSVLPIKWVGTTGAPVRAVAILDE
jgi:kynurenine formamidase